jgi:hypothetical protein
MKKLFLIALLGCLVFAAEPAKVDGKWQIAMTTPHGPMNGTLDLKQDGAKLSGSLDTEHTGSLPLTGTVDGESLTMDLEAQGMAFTMSGKLEGGKLSGTIDPSFGSWTATRAALIYR